MLDYFSYELEAKISYFLLKSLPYSFVSIRPTTAAVTWNKLRNPFISGKNSLNMQTLSCGSPEKNARQCAIYLLRVILDSRVSLEGLWQCDLKKSCRNQNLAIPAVKPCEECKFGKKCRRYIIWLKSMPLKAMHWKRCVEETWHSTLVHMFWHSLFIGFKNLATDFEKQQWQL